MLKVPYTFFCLLFGFSAGASDFGSLEQARALAERVIAVYEERGVVDAINFVHEPAAGLGDQPLGVNLIHEGRLVADNREPETVGFDYTSAIDLSGANLWSLVQAALQSGEEEVAFRWAHYDTGAPYDYRCILRAADNGQVVAMVCR